MTNGQSLFRSWALFILFILFIFCLVKPIDKYSLLLCLFDDDDDDDEHQTSKIFMILILYSFQIVAQWQYIEWTCEILLKHFKYIDFESIHFSLHCANLGVSFLLEQIKISTTTTTKKSTKCFIALNVREKWMINNFKYLPKLRCIYMSLSVKFLFSSAL